MPHIEECFKFAEPNIELVATWCMGISLYHGWNYSIELAKKEDAWLAVLNDDIQLFEDKSVSTVAGVLADSPSYAIAGLNWLEPPQSTPVSARPLRQVHGSYRHHGVGGFAWVCDPQKIRTVPESLVWWGGDDAIFFYAEEDGHKLGIANHVHVQHENELTANSDGQEWTHTAKEQDRHAFELLFPGRGW